MVLSSWLFIRDTSTASATYDFMQKSSKMRCLKPFFFFCMIFKKQARTKREPTKKVTETNPHLHRPTTTTIHLQNQNEENTHGREQVPAKKGSAMARMTRLSKSPAVGTSIILLLSAFIFFILTLPPDHLLLYMSPNIGPLKSRWELD